MDKRGRIGRDIVVIGASAGGVEALTGLAAGLPADLPAAVFVTVHVPPYAVSSLPDILSRAGALPAAHALDGEAIQPGRIYVAPPNHHLLLEDGVVRLSLGPRVNHTRPAIDPLFMSAARVYGPRVIGIVLSGMLDDGTAGLQEIKAQGGVGVIQDPQEALFPSMPQSVLEHGGADYVLPAQAMGDVLRRLTQDTLLKQELSLEQKGSTAMTDETPPAEETVQANIAAQEQGERDGMLTVFTCPECGGSLWQADAGTLVRFRCHTGHVMSGATLFAEQAEHIEKSLWYAARSLRDKARLARQLAHDARARGSVLTAERFEVKGQLDDAHATALEGMIQANAAVDEAA